MVNPKALLSESDFELYRNVRVIAAVFVLYGIFLVIAGTMMLAGTAPDPRDRNLPPALAACLAGGGVLGVLGGLGILFRQRLLSEFAYVWPIFYVWQLPIGTVLSVQLWSNLAQYLRILTILKGTEPADR